jgi:hypothetical protein
MDSQTNEQPSEQALLELGFGPDPPAAVPVADIAPLELSAELSADDSAGADDSADDADAADDADPAEADDPAERADAAASAKDKFEAELEADLENDPALVPAGASALLVAPAVLDPQEVEALLSGLHALLEDSSAAAAANALAVEQHKDSGYEPDSQAVGCDRRHSQFQALAWLFPNHAGTGRSARHQQGHHLRARERPGKKTRAAARSPQGSLFGDHR